MQQYATGKLNLFAIIFVVMTIAAQVRGCDETITLRGVHSPEGGNRFFNFSLGSIPSSGFYAYTIGKEGVPNVRSFSYNNGMFVVGSDLSNSDVTNTGNLSAGIISYNLSNIEKAENGVYEMKLGTQTIQCITLYVGGTLEASLEADKTTVKEGERVIFSCMGISTAEPSGMPFTYSWAYNSESLDPLTDSRINGEKLTISSVGADDEGEYTCMVTEDVDSERTASATAELKITRPECCCCCICCFIVLIVSGALSILFAGGHIGLTWKNHEFSVKKIHSNEAVCLKDFGIKAALPESCNCVGTIVIHIAVYFAALAKDCNKDCDDCCGVVICLVVTIIVSVVKAAIGPGIIYLFVYVKGCNYVDQAGQPVPTSNGQVELSAKT